MLLVVLASLVLATAGLTTANAVRGPRLSRTDVDVASLVAGPGQRLVLGLDQPVDPLPASAVTITPSVPVDVAADPTTVSLRFRDALPYGTRFTVTLHGARSRATGTTGDLTYAFTTPDATVLYLRRGTAAQDDVILRRTVGSTATTIVFQAPRIQEFTSGAGRLAVVTQDENHDGTRSVLPSDGSAPPHVIVANAEIAHLHLSGDGDILGFTFVKPDLAGGSAAPLNLWDATSGSNTLIQPAGLGGGSLDVRDWDFVPGTRQIVAIGADENAALIDPLGTSPAQPLGLVTGLWGFVPGTTTVFVDRDGVTSSIDLATGRNTPEAFRPARGTSVYRLLPRADGQEPYAVLARQSADGDATYTLQRLAGATARPVYRPAAGTWLRYLCGSPNGQYVAVEQSSTDTAPDQYGVREQFLGASTLILDAATNASVATLDGTDVSWCG